MSEKSSPNTQPGVRRFAPTPVSMAGEHVDVLVSSEEFDAANPMATRRASEAHARKEIDLAPASTSSPAPEQRRRTSQVVLLLCSVLCVLALGVGLGFGISSGKSDTVTLSNAPASVSLTLRFTDVVVASFTSNATRAITGEPLAVYALRQGIAAASNVSNTSVTILSVQEEGAGAPLWHAIAASTPLLAAAAMGRGVITADVRILSPALDHANGLVLFIRAGSTGAYSPQSAGVNGGQVFFLTLLTSAMGVDSMTFSPQTTGLAPVLEVAGQTRNVLPSATSTATGTATATPTATSTETATCTATSTETATSTSTATGTAVGTATATPSATSTETATSTATATGTATGSPSATPATPPVFPSFFVSLSPDAVWMSDGTPGGTVPITQATGDSAIETPSFMALYQQHLVVIASRPSTGLEPYAIDLRTNLAADVSDNLFLVADLAPGAESSMALSLNRSLLSCTVNGVDNLFSFGRALSSILTVSRTGSTHTTLKSSIGLTFGSGDHRVCWRHAQGGLYLSMGIPATGMELWRTDGTPPGTHVLDVCPGTASSNPAGIVVNGSWLYFQAQAQAACGGSSDVNSSLYRVNSDFSVLETPSHGVCVLAASSFDRMFTLGAFVYFTAAAWGQTPTLGTKDLWRSDGTPAGTKVFTTFPIHSPYTSASRRLQRILQTVQLNGRMFILGLGQGGFPSITTLMYVTDGTTSGSRVLTGANFMGFRVDKVHESVGAPIIACDTSAFFMCEHYLTPNTVRLCKTDGTFSGTVVVSTAHELSADITRWACLANGTLLFWASAGPSLGPAAGFEPYLYNGTAVSLLKDMKVGNTSSIPRTIISGPV